MHFDISMNFMYVGFDAFSSCNVEATHHLGLEISLMDYDNLIA